MSEARIKRRKENYALLRNAGFSSKEATKYKDLSRNIIAIICERKIKARKEIEELVICQKRKVAKKQ